MERKRNRKGFTLAELLIVVAIIAVLVAIAIPVFTRQLERSREATDLANVRSAYAELVTAYLTEGKEQSAEVGVKQTIVGWQSNGDASTASIGTDIKASGAGTSVITVPFSSKHSTYVLSIASDGSVTVTTK